MTELKLFELISEADCELLARSDVHIKVRRKIGPRMLLVAAMICTVVMIVLFVGVFATVRNYREQHPEATGGFIEVLSGVLSDEESFISEFLPKNVKLELSELIARLGGQNSFVPLGPGEEQQSTGMAGTEPETEMQPETETETEAETEDETESTNSNLWHTECEYCGKLDGENRWFIAKVVDSKYVKPIGEKCFEAVAAGDAGFRLSYFDENLITEQGLVAGDIVRVTYSGYIMETYPCQIVPISIEPEEQSNTGKDQTQLPKPDTNLEFWIAENVDNVDFSEYQEKYGMFGGRQYYGKGYVPTIDQDGQIDPEHCVIYTVTSYPDCSDKEQHITNIYITDPAVTLYGISVNTSIEEFTRIMQEHGFEVAGSSATMGKYSISLYQGYIYIRVEVENKDGIIY